MLKAGRWTAVASLLIVALVCVGCAHRAGTTTPVSPWEQVMTDNNLLAQANNFVAKSVVNVNAALPDKLSVKQAAVILREQKKIAGLHEQLTNILNQGPGVATVASITPLIEQIKSSANAMVSSGDLNIKDPASQATILSYVNSISALAESILTLVGNLSSAAALDDVQMYRADVLPDPSNPGGMALLIAQLVALALSTAPLLITDIAKLRALLQQSPDVAANLKRIFDDTIAIDEDTKAVADKFFEAHGLDPETLQPK